MWRKISTHVEVRKGEDEKCAVEKEDGWGKRRDGRRAKDAEHAYARTKVVGGREKRESWWG